MPWTFSQACTDDKSLFYKAKPEKFRENVIKARLTSDIVGRLNSPRPPTLFETKGQRIRIRRMGSLR